MNTLSKVRPYEEKINWFKPSEIIKAIKQYQAMHRLITTYNNGIEKAIDETREIAETIYQKNPQFLQENWWILGCLKTHDEYLCEIQAVMFPELMNKNNLLRKWPSYIKEEIQKKNKELRETKLKEPVQNKNVEVEKEKPHLFNINKYYQDELSKKVMILSDRVDSVLIESPQYKIIQKELKRLQDMSQLWEQMNQMIEPPNAVTNANDVKIIS